ncbi:MAG: hypothetical protein JNL01_11365 [Bdellovibrionales bacterium]|nr:hypothetical protein [Bdellovibrionales bacterium]
MLNKTQKLLPLLVLLGIALPDRVRADGRILWEFGAGLSFQNTASPFYNTTQPNLDMGTAMVSSVLFQLTRPYSRLRIFFGPSIRYGTGSDATNYFGMTNAHLMLRFALPGLYLGAGYAPWVYRRDSTAQGLTGFQKVAGVSAYMAEAGIEVIVNPEASLGIAASIQAVNNGGLQSPKYAIDGTAYVRIYFMATRDTGSDSEDFSGGWRYPFGLEKKKY